MIELRPTKEFLKDVFFLVEANSYETQKLWEENQKNWSFTWEQEVGIWERIGELDGMPVCISLMPVRIQGKRVIFWEFTSMVKDSRMAEKFFKDNECEPKWDRGTRSATTNPSNFHHCAQAIQENLKRKM